MTLTERGALNVEQHEIPTLFKHWERMMMMNHLVTYPPDENLKVVEGCSRYGYVAEEVCRERAMFITKRGRLGLGSTHISPGEQIYLIHGLKTPFTIYESSQGHKISGECYVNGLMDQKVQASESDVYIKLI
jgi:hypothetical protein